MGEQHPTIKVSLEFKKWLEKRGNKGESFEDIIKRLIPSYLKTHKREVKLITKQKKGEKFREMKSEWVEK